MFDRDRFMREFTTLLIVLSAVATAEAQPVGATPVFSRQPDSRDPGSDPSQGSYSRSMRTPRGTYPVPTSRPSVAARRPRPVYPRAVYPQAVYQPPQYRPSQYSNPETSMPTAAVQTSPGVPSPTGIPQPSTSQPPFGAGFGTPFSQQVQPASGQPTDQNSDPDDAQRRVREEEWRQFQLQEAQRLAYFQRYGDAASQRFWQEIYTYNRSFYNQNQYGYSFQGQNRFGQNQYGYSTWNQALGNQAYAQPSFHNQSRFNQGPPIYSFHNIIVPGVGGWQD